MTHPTCDTCHYAGMKGTGKNGAGEEVPTGFCFRYPPQIQASGVSGCPSVGLKTSWCGEWKAATESESVPPKPAARAAKPKGKR